MADASHWYRTMPVVERVIAHRCTAVAGLGIDLGLAAATQGTVHALATKHPVDVQEQDVSIAV